MSKAYVLEGTENEYLLVMRVEDKSLIYAIIDRLATGRNKEIQELAFQLEKSLHDNGRDPSKAGPKNKSKSPASNNNKRRKTKDS